MKKIIIIAITILSIVSCGKKDDPQPSTTSTTVFYRDQLKGTWLLTDEGDQQGSYYGRSGPTYTSPSVGVTTTTFIDSTMLMKFSPTQFLSYTYYLDNTNWLYRYLNPKKQYTVYDRAFVGLTIYSTYYISTNDYGQWQKWVKQ